MNRKQERIRRRLKADPVVECNKIRNNSQKNIDIPCRLCYDKIKVGAIFLSAK